MLERIQINIIKISNDQELIQSDPTSKLRRVIKKKQKKKPTRAFVTKDSNQPPCHHAQLQKLVRARYIRIKQLHMRYYLGSTHKGAVLVMLR